MAKKTMYSFAKKKHSGRGILSTVLGGISLVAFFVLAAVANYFGGKAGSYVGGIGLVAVILSLAGLIYGFLSLTERSSKTFFPKMGALLSAVVFLGWIAVFLIGIGK